MIIHFLMIPLFVIATLIIVFLKLLNIKYKIEKKKIVYIKIGVLFFLWIISILSIYIVGDDINIQLIYLGISVIYFIVGFLLIRNQEKKYNPKTDVLSTWKKCSRILNLNFIIKKHGNINLPVIYGNKSGFYIEIFPYNEQFNNNIYDAESKKIIAIRVFKKERTFDDKEFIFSYDRRFKEKNKGFSYIDNHIEPNWSKTNIPDLKDDFYSYVEKIVKKSKYSLSNL